MRGKGEENLGGPNQNKRATVTQHATTPGRPASRCTRGRALKRRGACPPASRPTERQETTRRLHFGRSGASGLSILALASSALEPPCSNPTRFTPAVAGRIFAAGFPGPAASRVPWAAAVPGRARLLLKEASARTSSGVPLFGETARMPCAAALPPRRTTAVRGRNDTSTPWPLTPALAISPAADGSLTVGSESRRPTSPPRSADV